VKQTCGKCGGYIIPPASWMSVDPPVMCKSRWPRFDVRECKRATKQRKVVTRDL